MGHCDDDGGENTTETRLARIVDLYVRTGIQVHSPGFMGRQFSGVAPLASVLDFVSSVVNQPSSFYEAGQLPNVVERIMADELGRLVGWVPGAFAMVTTSGGSLANLTALLSARNRRYPHFWDQGSATPHPACRELRPAIAVGADAHYSIARVAGIMGIGESCVVRLPLDDEGRIRPEMVRPALAEASDQGLDVFCLVATAGTTSRGAFDPIGDLAGLARERGMWLHVDGAHGASLVVSDRLRPRVGEINQADSLTWDAHKLLFVPAPCTLLFYRREEDSRRAFRQDASYVFTSTPDVHSLLDSGDRNFECTKRPMIMTLWALWAIYGRAFFAQKIDALCRVTEAAHEILLQEPDFQAIHRPESNILCFRHRPAGLRDQDVHGFQLAVRDKVRLRGKFFISKVDVDGVAALRVVLSNHETTPGHFRMLLDEIRQCGQVLVAPK
jgi:L-2,4-diaminobutyrate decarboxylase